MDSLPVSDEFVQAFNEALDSMRGLSKVECIYELSRTTSKWAADDKRKKKHRKLE